MWISSPNPYCVTFPAELKMTYLKKPYFVTMGTFHMGVLLPFNNAESLNLRDLLDSTQMPEKELVKQLQVLVEAKLVVASVSYHPVLTIPK